MAFKIGHIGWNKGGHLTEEHRENLCKSLVGRLSSIKGKTKANRLYPENCGFQSGHPKYSSIGDFKKGEGMGRENSMFGKIDIVRNNSKREFYKTTYFRSGWEVKYAKWLDKNNIKWEYEKDTFKLKDTTYTPDFYLTGKDTYVEIKGFMHADAYFKIKEFLLNNPDIKYTLIVRKDLQELGVI